MSPVIVSPQGLVSCPGCQSHVRFEGGSELVCPFCGTATPVRSRRSKAQGAAIAAVLVGSQVACGTNPPVPLYGAPADVEPADAVDAADGASTDVGADLSVDPEVDADVADPDSGVADIVEGDADVPPAPPYGIPPEPDAP